MVRLLSTVTTLYWLNSMLAMTESYKVLFITIPVGSHMLQHGAIAHAMVKRGHQAHILKPQAVKVPSQLKDFGIKFIPWDKKGKISFISTREFEERVAEFSKLNPINMMARFQDMMSNICEEILLNDELYHTLLIEKYDFVMVENNPGSECFKAVARGIGVPYGAVAVISPVDIFSETMQIYYLSPTAPMFYSEEPSFMYRFFQFTFITVVKLAYHGLGGCANATLIHEYTKHNPIQNMYQLTKDTKIWLVDNEPMVNVVRHHVPHVIEVGGLSAGPTAALPGDMAQFADSAEEGLIIVSFGGSLTATFPPEQVEKLLKVLSEVKFKTIMRLKSEPNFTTGSNILLVDWLPQNDLLGHPNTVLFITHCGLNSVNEATYHGVPMLAFPNQFEQSANAARAKVKGHAEILDRDSFTVEEFQDLVNIMTSEPKYKQKIRKSSRIMQSRRYSPGEEAAYWIEHVIKFGNEHLLPYTTQLYWYQILMLDVVAALIVIFAIFVFIIIKCLQFCTRRCCGKRHIKEKKN